MQEISVAHNFQGYFSRTFQELKLQFPGLSKSWNLKKIQDFPGGVETLCIGLIKRTKCYFENVTFGKQKMTKKLTICIKQ